MGLRKRKEFRWSIHYGKIPEHVEKNRDMKWESKNGKITMLKDMDTNHIKNCIAKQKREPSFIDGSVLEALELEIIYRTLLITEH